MNTTKYRDVVLRRTLIATAVASMLLAACTTAPVKPDGAAEARVKLTQLQTDPNLASRAAAAIKDADSAVRAAEQPEADKEVAAHRVYLADRKVDTAKALAEARFAEDERAALTAQRDSARLDARTREADAAKGQAATARAEGAQQKVAADQARSDADAANGQAVTARAEGAQQKMVADQARRDADAANGQAVTARAEGAQQKMVADQARRDADAAGDRAATARAEGAQQKIVADQARSDADAARLATASSEQQAAELQRQLDVLHAKPTDHGLVLTLGDVLFTSGKADLKPGATGHLNKLVAFLDKYPDRSVAIQGYTDSVGGEEYNQGLSERRANSVKSYLAGQGIGATRLSASGKGQSDPVAGNDSAAGRQQNRRVEVVISNPPAASR